MASFSEKTLGKCNAIAATMNPERFLSLDGRKLLKIIGLLAEETPTSPTICAQLAAIGAAHKWDMENMTPQQERGFCKWLVDMWLAGNR